MSSAIWNDAIFVLFSKSSAACMLKVKFNSLVYVESDFLPDKKSN